MLPDLSRLSLQESEAEGRTLLEEPQPTDAPKRGREELSRPFPPPVVEKVYDEMVAYIGNPGIEEFVESEYGMYVSSRRPNVDEVVATYPMEVSLVVIDDRVYFKPYTEQIEGSMTLEAQFKLVCVECAGSQSTFQLAANGVITSVATSDLGEVEPFTEEDFNATLQSLAPQLVKSGKMQMVPGWTSPIKFQTTALPRATSLMDEVSKYRVGLKVVNPPYEGGFHVFGLRTLVTTAVRNLLANTARKVMAQRAEAYSSSN
jgi:hypothetical protein